MQDDFRKERPLDNPTAPALWPDQPETPKEFEEWLEKTRQRLQLWRDKAEKRAHERSTERAIKQYNDSVQAAWAPLEAQADVQTGTIYRSQANASCNTRGAAKGNTLDDYIAPRKELHEKHVTWHRHLEHQYAQAAWEDFHYYQNVWNRKDLNPNQMFCLTKKERIDHEGRFPKAKVPRRTIAPHRWVTRDENHDPFFHDYKFWMENFIQVCTKFKLGYRKRVPDTIKAADAHRYSTPSRGTHKRRPQLRENQKPHDHIFARFPDKENPFDDDEVEENYPSLDMINQSYVRREKQNDISIEDIIIDESNDLDLDLPARHRQYVAAFSTSLDWPTSFDDPERRDVTAKTIKHRTYITVDNADTVDPNDPDKQRKISKEEDDTILIRDTRPRYRMETVPTGKTTVFKYAIDPRDGRVVGRDRNTGEWIGTWEEGVEEEERWAGGGETRERLPDSYLFKLNYQVVEESTTLKPDDTRRRRQELAGKSEEFSDDEEERDLWKDSNYKRSATYKALSGVVHENGEEGSETQNTSNSSSALSRLANSDPVDPGPPGSDLPGSNLSSSDPPIPPGPLSNPHPLDPEDEPISDDGDLFRQSYKECVRGPITPRTAQARALHQDLVSTLGVLSGWTVDHVRDALAHGLSEQIIRDNYTLYAPYNTRARALHASLVATHGALPDWNMKHVQSALEIGLEEQVIRDNYELYVRAMRERAQAIHAELVAAHGPLAGWSVEHVVEAFRRGLTEETVRDNCREYADRAATNGTDGGEREEGGGGEEGGGREEAEDKLQ